MQRFYFFIILLFRFTYGFYLQDETEDKENQDNEPCTTRCENGGQCFLSSFCICPKGFSGRYCEISINEQCGTFPSMSTIEIDCVLCICYNGLFMCDIQPYGLCRKSNRLLPRSIQIKRALHLLQIRFRNIHSFEPLIRENVTLDDDQQLINLSGYRIILNHSIIQYSSFVLILFCLLIIYLFK